MGDFGDNSIDAAGKKAGQPQGAETERHTDEDKQAAEHSADGGQKTAQTAQTKMLTEISASGQESQTQSKPIKPNSTPIELASKSTGKPTILDFLPLMLDAVVMQAGDKQKSYSFVVDLDSEAERKLLNAPQSVKDFYKGTREAQLDHEPIGLALLERLNPADAANYRDQWAEMNAWLAFPEEDKECKEGRTIYQTCIKHVIDSAMKGPLTPEEQKKAENEEFPQLAKIYSLLQNDHDYLHNEDELTRRNGMHHLPEVFAGIGMNGETKTFNLKAVADKHMLSILPNASKSKLEPDERANLTFYLQVLRQVLPAELLDEAHKGERDNILKDYVDKYTLRNKDLSKAGETVWQAAADQANRGYPQIAKIKPSLELSAAESLYEFFTLVDLRQLAIEARVMRTLYPNLTKGAELAYPDQARLYAAASIPGAIRENREGQKLCENRYLNGVFQPAVKPYTQLNAKETQRLKQWQATPNDWQLVYWHDNPNTKESKIQVEAHLRFPDSLQCSFSNEGAELLRKWQSGKFVPAEETNRLAELEASLRDAKTKQSCVHDSESRKKGK